MITHVPRRPCYDTNEKVKSNLVLLDQMNFRRFSEHPLTSPRKNIVNIHKHQKISIEIFRSEIIGTYGQDEIFWDGFISHDMFL